MGEAFVFSTTWAPAFEEPEILWDFGDGSVAEGSAEVVHAFSRPGNYEVVVRLVDSDGNIGEAMIPVDVEPSFTTLDDLLFNLEGIPADALKSEDVARRDTLVDKTIEITQMLSRGDIKGAKQKLEKDIRAKMDGCPSVPDNNDWVVDCAWQYDLRVLIDDLIQSLEDILGG